MGVLDIHTYAFTALNITVHVLVYTRFIPVPSPRYAMSHLVTAV